MSNNTQLSVGLVIPTSNAEKHLKKNLKVIDQEQNKVLVIDASGVNHASMIGDQIAASAVKNNWAGIVVNSCIRDVEELKTLPIGIFAKGVVAQKTNKKNHGFEDVLISFGSVVMSSGNWIYIDQNGWLVADNKLEL